MQQVNAGVTTLQYRLRESEGAIYYPTLSKNSWGEMSRQIGLVTSSAVNLWR